jgi:hypothetical protein
MNVVARVDDFGRPAWIALAVLGFCLYWPIGLGLLAFIIGSGRMGWWTQGGPGRWHYGEHGCGWGRHHRRRREGGNRAFDEYRAETLRRLEEEEREFREFLDRLRFAKDKAEFDEFLAERRRRAGEPPEKPSAA